MPVGHPDWPEVCKCIGPQVSTLEMDLRHSVENMNNERRTKSRYPLELTVQYQTMGSQELIAGSGRTLNVSSSGMLISAEHDLPEGTNVRVTIEWPTLLNGKTALQLVTTGKIVRRVAFHYGVAFDHYQFRTRKPRPAVPLPAAIAAAMAENSLGHAVSARSSLNAPPAISLRNVG